MGDGIFMAAMLDIRHLLAFSRGPVISYIFLHKCEHIDG